MSAHDPILSAIRLRFERFILFIVLSALISIISWVWILLGWFEIEFGSIWQLTKDAYSPTEKGKSIVLIFRSCGVIGVLTTSVTFLVAALWWRKSGDVHRRGAQFVDARDGRS
ncbi:MAG: hypothetical protein ACO1N8_11200 [Methylophilus sp.]